MSTQVPPAPAPQGLTADQLKALIAETAKAVVGPAIEAALAPLTKAQGDVMERLGKALDKGQDAENELIEKGLGKYPYGRKARAVALAVIEGGSSSDPEAAIFALKRSQWAPTIVEPTVKWLQKVKESIAKGLTVGNASGAGDMVFPQQDPEWIQLLRNNALIRGIARTVPMPRGASSRRKQTAASTATYQGELGPIVDSAPSVGRVNLSYKKLTGATVVSNDLLRFGGAEADRFVQEDLVRVSALREDRAFLVGNPPTDAGSPQGIRFQTVAAQIGAAAGASLANFQADITDMIADVEDANLPVDPSNSYIIMSPRTFWTIYALATTTGDMIFASMLSGARPTLFGYPVLKTTQLGVSNSWIGTNGGLVMFVYAPALEIHDSMARTVEAFRGGAYRDTTGTIQSGISNDETVITCIAEHDFLQVYDVAASIKTGYAT
jgi:HK97 family phage major capsid protein